MSGTKKVFRIVDRETQEVVGSYSRACHNVTEFDSVESARTANCHGMFLDKKRYAIAEYEVCEKLADPDCDKEEVEQ